MRQGRCAAASACACMQAVQEAAPRRDSRVCTARCLVEPGRPGSRLRVAAAPRPRVLSRGLCGGRHVRAAAQGGRACTVLAVRPDEPGGAPRRITSATVIEVGQEEGSAAAPAAP